MANIRPEPVFFSTVQSLKKNFRIPDHTVFSNSNLKRFSFKDFLPTINSIFTQDSIVTISIEQKYQYTLLTMMKCATIVRYNNNVRLFFNNNDITTRFWRLKYFSNSSANLINRWKKAFRSPDHKVILHFSFQQQAYNMIYLNFSYRVNKIYWQLSWPQRRFLWPLTSSNMRPLYYLL